MRELRKLTVPVKSIEVGKRYFLNNNIIIEFTCFKAVVGDPILESVVYSAEQWSSYPSCNLHSLTYLRMSPIALTTSKYRFNELMFFWIWSPDHVRNSVSSVCRKGILWSDSRDCSNYKSHLTLLTGIIYVQRGQKSNPTSRKI